MSVIGVERRRGLARGQRGAQRGVPLLIAVLAIAVTIGVFPNALHSTLSGPDRPTAIEPRAQAGVTHERDVPPLSLGKSGAEATGPSAGTGQNPNAPAGGELGGGSGGAVGAGSGPGGGAGGGTGGGTGPGGAAESWLGGGTGPNGSTQPPTPPTGSLVPTPPVPPGVGCSTCIPPSGAPRIPFCYSNSLGRDSQTTEDPLSPPCTAWDPSAGNGGATSQGVTAGQIDVVVLGIDSSADDYLNGPPTHTPCAASAGCVVPGQLWNVLRIFFQSHFQTFGRRVFFHGYAPDFTLQTTNPQAVARLVYEKFHPFAVVPVYAGFFSPYYAAFGIEFFDMTNLVATNADDSTLVQGAPFLWTVLPSADDVIGDGASWVCRSLIGNPSHPNGTTRSNDPKIPKGTPRRIALGYTTVPASDSYSGSTPGLAKELADRLAAAVDQMCGQGGHVFDQFGSDQDIHIQDNGPAHDPSVAQTALATMALQHDTSLLCAFCGEPNGLNDTGDPFAQDEVSLQYFPERLFLSSAQDNPLYARQNNQATYTNAFGLSVRWQVGAYVDSYWWRAATQTDPTFAPEQLYLMSAYEELMLLFSAIQLSGPALDSSHVASGLYTWHRGFSTSTDPVLSPTSPAAGFTPTDHSFLKGMDEEVWDASGAPPGGASQSTPNFHETQAGCYRIIDHATRHSTVPWPGTTPWPDADHSGESFATAPCTGDYD